MADFYALLIGIDFYEPNPHFNSLKGAVRDIDKMAEYLDKVLKIPAERTIKLTSPFEETHSLAGVRAARREDKPTYENIVEAFQTIIETAKADDLVYIHYSGHGMRAKTNFAEIKGENQNDECLVPMDVGEQGRYLRDVEMATLLKRMTDKGLIVTVVFDSCHSGGATRGDGEVRGARDGRPDLKDRPSDSSVATREELIENWRTLTQDRAKEGWLPDQRNYVFLAACRPSELAYESAFDGNDRNGALTYWMLDTLNSAPSGLTYQALYDRLKGQIQSKFPNQLPMILGEGDRLVFGRELKAVQYTLTVLQVDTVGNQVTLDAGMAQGLSRGTLFAIYPLGSNFTDPLKRLAVVEIIDLQASTCTARILTPQESGISVMTAKIEPGLSAVMESAPVELKRRIRLHIKKVGDNEDELPANLADKQAEALDKVRQVMQANGWVREVQEGEEGHYQVAVSREGEYEISSPSPIKNLTPPLTIDAPDAPVKVVNRLVHLAKYQAVFALDNPQSKLSIEFELLDGDRKPFPDRNNIKLRSGTVYVRIKNTHNQPLNIALLDLEATWAITSIPIQGMDTPFYQLSQDETLEQDLDFLVPEGEDYGNKTERLMLFATKGIANFKWLTLPSLDEDSGKRGSTLTQELKEIAQQRGVTRGEPPMSPLNQLLSQIGADIDQPPQITRSLRPKPTPNADWITKTIEIGFQR